MFSIRSLKEVAVGVTGASGVSFESAAQAPAANDNVAARSVLFMFVPLVRIDKVPTLRRARGYD
jgi:hypothetical protein